MKNTVYAYESNGTACLGFDDSGLYISTQKPHADFEELKQTALAFRQSNTNGYWVIDLGNIKEVQLHEEAPDFFIRYEKKAGKLSRFWFLIRDAATRSSFCSGLAFACGLPAKSSEANRYAQLPRDLLKLVIAGGLTWAFTYMAQNPATSRKALVKAVGDLLHSIGPVPVLAACGAVCAFFLFQLFKHLAQAGKTIKYTQS